MTPVDLHLVHWQDLLTAAHHRRLARAGFHPTAPVRRRPASRPERRVP